MQGLTVLCTTRQVIFVELNRFLKSSFENGIICQIIISGLLIGILCYGHELMLFSFYIVHTPLVFNILELAVSFTLLIGILDKKIYLSYT